MATSTKREYREGIDTFLLITAFVVGVGSALILKVFGLPPYIPAIAAAAVIIVYAVGTYTSSAARLEPEQIGDNCYYLGFCITLASLAYTLYALGSAGSDAAMLGDVISGFGVALSSTVVGVMARVVLLQFRVDLAARDKEARSQLNQVMRAFHSEMQTSVTSTREAVVQIRQTLQEHTEETIDHNKRMQESFEKRIEALVMEAVGGVKTAMQEVVESGKEMNKRISASSRTNMATAEKAMVESILTITAELRRASALLEAEMQRANTYSVKSLETIIMEVSAAMRMTSEEASKAIAAAREQQNTQMTEAVGSVAANVFELANQIGVQKDKISSALDGFTTETRTVSEEIRAMVKESAAAREEGRRAAQIVTVATQRITWATEKMEQSVQERARNSTTNTDQIPANQAPESPELAGNSPPIPATADETDVGQAPVSDAAKVLDRPHTATPTPTATEPALSPPAPTFGSEPASNSTSELGTAQGERSRIGKFFGRTS